MLGAEPAALMAAMAAVVGLISSPLPPELYCTRDPPRACRRVYYLNNLGSNTTIGGTNATPGKRTVTFTVFGAPDGRL